MKPKALPKIFPIRPKIIFTDVDDTLTWHGKLPAETYTALATLQQAGITVVPVTGASAGWCDCIVRTWPIDSIIGENGAFIMQRNQQGKLSYIHVLPESIRAKNWQQLQALKQDVLNQFDCARQTADQSFRINDIAFDVGQEVTIERSDAIKIAEYCKSKGANAKISSIHINVWLGDYDKSSTATKWLSHNGIESDKAIFIGDSPNDDVMFSSFTTTVGVANVIPFLDELHTNPTYVTEEPGGYGFVELANAVIEENPTSEKSGPG